MIFCCDRIENVEEKEQNASTLWIEAQSCLPFSEPHYKQLTSFTHKDDVPVELADELEHRKALIMEKYDALLDLRRKLRQEYVPLTVCTHLEQCIKETEVRVKSHNHFLCPQIDRLGDILLLFTV